MSLERGIVKPKEQANFRKSADVRVKKHKGKAGGTTKAPDLRFGVPSLPSDSMREVIRNEFGNAALEEMREKYQPKAVEKTQQKQTRSTSQSHSKPAVSSPPFKLKRFAAVPPRTHTHRT